MSAPPPFPAEAYTPDARAGRGASPRTAGKLAQWLALVLFCLLEPMNAVRLFRYGRMPSWVHLHDRPDLPAGSTQEEAAAIRGAFGNSIAWMCLRRGIGPGHADWPYLSRTIVAFGGSLRRFRIGAPALGLQCWESPYLVPELAIGFGLPASPTAASDALVQADAAADARLSAPSAMQSAAARVVQSEATHARLPAAWLAASRQHVFARAGPCSPTGPPYCPGLHNPIMSFARGQSMASPAILIRGNRTQIGLARP